MTTVRPIRVGALTLVAALAIAACGGGASTAPTIAPDVTPGPTTAESNGPTTPEPPSSDVVLQGAGATFPNPLYQVWFEAFNYKYNNIQIDYQSIGSGGGIKAITEQTVDFGASDAPMKDAEIAALPAGTTMLHIPTALGAVVVIFNLGDVKDLNLDADNVANIFLGNITNWNDPAIAANNPGVTLPDQAIRVVHRSDGSGTTNAFTTYLDTVSAEWHDKVGKGKEVNWPTGIGAPGNDGVAGGVKGDANVGAVGYVELNYATTAGLTSAKLKNAAGKFVAGSTDGVTAAAEGAAASFPADFRQAPIINGAGDATYPLASYTYLLVYKDQTDAVKGQTLVAFIYWCLTDGQATEGGLGYAPLPAPVKEKAIAELHEITTGGAPIWP
ncbi:MAG: phosphate ABC transporter substrate-binding protein PstS [Chloroflexota bacterium]|nr:MAG: phosphate ABC transporter substrate-binding protein PstS [Chloroflexota bacterium]